MCASDHIFLLFSYTSTLSLTLIRTNQNVSRNRVAESGKLFAFLPGRKTMNKQCALSVLRGPPGGGFKVQNWNLPYHEQIKSAIKHRAMRVEFFQLCSLSPCMSFRSSPKASLALYPHIVVMRWYQEAQPCNWSFKLPVPNISLSNITFKLHYTQ